MGALNQSFSKITKDRILQPFAGYSSGGIGAGGGGGASLSLNTLQSQLMKCLLDDAFPVFVVY